MKYRSRCIEVEAFEAADGQYVVRGADDELRVMAADAFHRLFEASGKAARPKAAKKDRAATRGTPVIFLTKPGRKPLPWFCRECSNNTAGAQCGSCGATRPAPAERTPAKDIA